MTNTCIHHAPARKKLLGELLSKVGFHILTGSSQVTISGIANDSRQVKPGFCFVAINGFAEDGTKYIGDAVQAGAVAVVAADPPDKRFPGVSWVQAENVRLVQSKMLSVLYDHVGLRLYNIGVTGTNGKTTVTGILAAILERQAKTARVGTLGMQIGGEYFKTSLTTPDATELFPFLAEAADKGVGQAVMEVSSVALCLYRVEDISFSQAIFTNFSGDHLDFHKTMDEYLNAKLSLFKKLEENNWAVINIDDPIAGRVIQELNCKYLTYGFSEDADVRPLHYRCAVSGIKARLHTPRGYLDISSPLMGRVNLSNIMAAVLSAMIKDVSFEDIAAAVAEFKPVKGRLDLAHQGEFTVLVDYAHTDHAMETLLKSLRELAEKRIIIVFGAGGNKDRSKRPRMGHVASTLADVVVITSDNPRKESPGDIINDILKGMEPGFQNFITEPDRERAIEKALDMAEAGDIVVIAGKGHEDYQIFKDKTIHFDDFEVVRRIMESKKNA